MRNLGFDFKKLEEKGLIQFLDLITIKEEGMATVLEMIISAVESFKAERLVIDSFSAIAQAFKEPREVRIFLHTLLAKIVKKIGCTTILIEEVPVGEKKIGFGFEEFVADGVLLLQTLHFEDKFIREMHIAKMRGVRISNPDVCFTLDNGFKTLPLFRYKKIEKARRYEPLPDLNDRYSTGVPDLDEALGGYPKGSSILLEIDEKVARQQYRLVLAPTLVNFVFKKRPVIIFPSAGVDWEDVVRVSEQYGVTEEMRNEFLKIVETKELLLTTSIPYVIPWEPKNSEEDYKKFISLEDELIKKTGNPVARLIGIDVLAHYYGESGALTLANLDVTRVKKVKGISIWLGKPIYPWLIERLTPLSDVHLKLTRRHGCLLLYGIKPRTTLYAIEMDVSKGYPMPRLTAIV